MDIGYRIPGTEERKNCAHYFISKFQEIDNNFTYVLHNFTAHSIDCQNVLLKLNTEYNNIIILGAHYDSRAKATKDPNSLNRSYPVPGANDGASGSAVLIELARVIYRRKINLSCQVWFLFFDAEDQGKDNAYGIENWGWCEGSQAFVEEINNFYNFESENFDCMILLDMVGGVDLRFIREQYSTSSLLDELFQIGRQLGYTDQFASNPTTASIMDDHRAFLNIGIPSADLIINFWDNPKWPYHHTTQDDLTHISNTSLGITGKTIEQFIYNNYFIGSNNKYQGKFPWNEDIKTPNLDLLIILLSIIAILGIILIITNSIKKDTLKKDY
ncbi:MAG: M28 family peptidase [Promethearchaeota archaeon]